MANVIDALLVTLGLDTKDFEKGAGKAEGALDKTNKATVKQTKDLEAMGKKGADALNKLKNEALTLTAILLGASGMKEWVAGTVKANIQAGNLGKALNMSVNDINAWKRAASAAGGNGDDMEAALSSMNSALEEFKLRATISGPLAAFATLKINARDAKGEVIGAHEAMLRIANNMQGRTPQDQAHILQTIMGFGSGATPLLTKGAAEVQKTLNHMHELGDTTEEAYEKTKKLNAAWVELEASVKGVGTAILNEISTPLVQTLNTLTKIAQAVKQVADGKPADPAIKRKQEGALRNSNSYLWDLIFGKAEPGRQSVSGSVTTDVAASSAAPDSGLFSRLESTHGLPAGLLDSVWSAESGRGKNMLSPAGAMGHFQFMPETAKTYGLKDPNDINQSANAAARMLHDLLNHYGGNMQAALAGYNWGMGNVDRKGMGNLPMETRGYISKVMGGMPIGARATAGASGAPVDNSIHIENVTLQTGATNAQALSNDLRAKAGRQTTVAQATSGLQQ